MSSFFCQSPVFSPFAGPFSHFDSAFYTRRTPFDCAPLHRSHIHSSTFPSPPSIFRQCPSFHLKSTFPSSLLHSLPIRPLHSFFAACPCFAVHPPLHPFTSFCCFLFGARTSSCLLPNSLEIMKIPASFLYLSSLSASVAHTYSRSLS